jgi:outer membrane autotransporter protein
VISSLPASVPAPFTATFTFSEPVTGFGVGDITVGNGAASNLAGAGAVYTALITPAAVGPVTLDVAPGAAVDAAGNDSQAAAQITTQYDGTAPTVLIAGVPETVNGPFEARFVFSEPVTGFATGDIALSNGQASQFKAISATEYSALITPVRDGNVTIDIAADAARNGAGLGNVAATQAVSRFDGIAPTVSIFAPTQVRGDFNVTVRFSEAVFGFARGDISVANGVVKSLRGNDGDQTFTARVSPRRSGAVQSTRVTISIAEAVAFDTAGNGNEAAKPVTLEYIDEDFVRTRTQRVISNFMSRRADQITANEPDLASRLSGATGSAGNTLGANFSASGDLRNNRLAFASSLRQLAQAAETRRSARRSELGPMMGLTGSDLDGGAAPDPGFDLWVQGKWASIDSDTARHSLGLLYVGAEYRFSPMFVAGLLAQFDWSEEQDETVGSEIDGNGWLAGPYVVARLHKNAIFDGRIAWGLSDNSVSPFMTYSDSFETSRWLAKAQLTGDFDIGGWQFAPHVGLIYFSETQQGYTDSLGIEIPGQTVDLGRVTFGPRVSTQVRPIEGLVVAPFIGLKGIWDFDRAAVVDVATGLAPASGSELRGRIEGGVSVQLGARMTLTGEGFYDGIGARDLDAYGGSAKLKVPLN